MKSEFRTPLDIRALDDGTWQVLSPLVYYSEIYNGEIVVPTGFVTDLASVPRLPIIYDLWGDRAHYESVVHDWCYFSACVEKQKADKIFLEAMVVREKPLWIREPMYLAVKYGAGKAWSDHRKKGDPNQACVSSVKPTK